MTRLEFESFSEFGAALLERGVEKVVRREVREIRPYVGEKQYSVIIGLVHSVTFIGYKGGEVLHCVLKGEDVAAFDAWLEQHGIETKQVSGNIS